jgi:hypothetical protein
MDSETGESQAILDWNKWVLEQRDKEKTYSTKWWEWSDKEVI